MMFADRIAPFFELRILAVSIPVFSKMARYPRTESKLEVLWLLKARKIQGRDPKKSGNLIAVFGDMGNER